MRYRRAEDRTSQKQIQVDFIEGYDYDLFRTESIDEDDLNISIFSILMKYVAKALEEISEMILSTR